MMSTTSRLSRARWLAAALGTLFSSVAPPVAAEPTAPAAAPSLSAADVVARVLATYAGSEGFRVHFVQRTWEWDEPGRVLVERSGEMRWRFDRTGTRIVTDGETLRAHSRSGVTELETASSYYPAVVAFWSGDPTESFSFALLAPTRGKNPPLILAATPKAPSANYARALFYLDAATHRVERVMILDRVGNRLRFDIKRVEPIP
jgi:outer membrane lipoprotein-sorting protein